MHALIVVGHHDPQSLTHALARQVADGLASVGHSSEIADLASEGFDPRFSLADHAVHRRLAAPPADVLNEQARIERADALVLVYPIYWWSLPALLKGSVPHCWMTAKGLTSSLTCTTHTLWAKNCLQIARPQPEPAQCRYSSSGSLGSARTPLQEIRRPGYH